MFRSCRYWQTQLKNRNKSEMPERKRHAFETHLAECVQCRDACYADSILAEALVAGRPSPSAEWAMRFDERVIAKLKGTDGVLMTSRTLWQRCVARLCGAFPADRVLQMTGGAMIAASVTAICLLSALHPTGPNVPDAGRRNSAAVRGGGELGMPLESLFANPAPRAAMLWTSPAGTPTVRAAALPPTPVRHLVPAPHISGPHAAG